MKIQFFSEFFMWSFFALAVICYASGGRNSVFDQLLWRVMFALAVFSGVFWWRYEHYFQKSLLALDWTVSACYLMTAVSTTAISAILLGVMFNIRRIWTFLFRRRHPTDSESKEKPNADSADWWKHGDRKQPPWNRN